MTDWAGNKERQKHLAARIVRECKLAREDPIDIAGAVGTVAANMIADLSPSLDVALEGLQAHHGDLVSTVKKRFGVTDQ